jgi:hypothetical protein
MSISPPEIDSRKLRGSTSSVSVPDRHFVPGPQQIARHRPTHDPRSEHCHSRHSSASFLRTAKLTGPSACCPPTGWRCCTALQAGDHRFDPGTLHRSTKPFIASRSLLVDAGGKAGGNRRSGSRSARPFVREPRARKARDARSGAVAHGRNRRHERRLRGMRERRLARPLSHSVYSIGISKRAMMPGSPCGSRWGFRVATHA